MITFELICLSTKVNPAISAFKTEPIWVRFNAWLWLNARLSYTLRYTLYTLLKGINLIVQSIQIIGSGEASQDSWLYCSMKPMLLSTQYDNRNKTSSPNVGLEPTTLRLRVSCSTDWASRADIDTAFSYANCIHSNPGLKGPFQRATKAGLNLL